MWHVWLVCALLAAQGLTEDAPSVVTSQGALKGVVLESRGGRKFSAFQGIPYASPPVGPLRFQKPLPAGSWEGERDAAHPGSPCIQSNYTSKGLIFGSEDCLYLNVYSHKASNESKTPVLVFIHGGGFMEGFGDLYQPDYFMDKDIVLVTFNYRLGVLGFLSMEDKYLPGNNGLKDQTAALRWVRDNIAQFGGDPGSVTLYGESAGASSVHYHMLSPLSKGLFHRGIAQSGSAYCPWATHGPGEMRAVSEGFAAQLGCNHFTTQDVLDCLREIPGYVLVEIQNSLHEWHMDPIVPFRPAVEPERVEDAFITTDPWQLSSDIPLLAGLTSAEGILKTTMLDKTNIIQLNEDFEMLGPLTLLFRGTAVDPVQTAFAIKKFYFLDGDIKPENMEGLTNMYSDSWFVHPVLESFRRHRGPKYFYHFEYKGANSLAPDNEGVSHFDDMQFFFPMNQHYKKYFNTSAEDTEMSKKLLELWTNFITHGKPTVDSSDVTWTEASTSTEYLRIKKDGFVMADNLLKERDDFWSSLAYREKYLPIEKLAEMKRDEL